MIRTIILALLIASPAVAGESWSTAMTPLDPRPPLPKPSEPDADTDNNGPFRSPAPAVLRTSARKPAAKPRADCKCDPCLCAAEVEVEPRLEPVAETPKPRATPKAKAKATSKPKAVAPEDDPRLTRNAQGYYFGTASNGSVYYSTVAADVLACLDNPPAPQPVRYYTQPTTTDYLLGTFGGASCATGNCPR